MNDDPPRTGLHPFLILSASYLFLCVWFHAGWGGSFFTPLADVVNERTLHDRLAPACVPKV